MIEMYQSQTIEILLVWTVKNIVQHIVTLEEKNSFMMFFCRPYNEIWLAKLINQSSHTNWLSDVHVIDLFTETAPY